MMMMTLIAMVMMLIAMMLMMTMMKNDVDGKDDCDDDDYYVDITTLWSLSLLLLFLFLASEFPQCFLFFGFLISIIICVHCCRHCLRRHRIIVSVIYLCELFLLHPQKGRIGMAVLALRVLQTLQFVPCRWRSHQRSTVP